ncbi:exonuclease SbcCD subunit D, partial [bacterium]|nr:exonuclease SbcCD subunit D [bacterium]
MREDHINMPKILHFADAHIDIATHGRRDAETGLPIRVMDFLKALDTIIDTAISEKVDMVIFAGDAYKDRQPAPTFQREWGKRIIRLSNARIPTLLLVGNHDLSPASGRAHTLQEFDTLQVPYVHVLYRPMFLKPTDLDGVLVQVIAIPWIYRSAMMALNQFSGAKVEDVNEELEKLLSNVLRDWLDQLDPTLPAILTAHGSVQGAVYGNERTIMLGKDLVLPGNLVKDSRLDYVALGHIHKAQDVNEGAHPPVVYAGSIERVDFGEADDEKSFVIAEVEKGHTSYRRVRLDGRKFIDRKIRVTKREEMITEVQNSLPNPLELEDAIFRLTVEYPRDLEIFLDEQLLRQACARAFEFHLVRRPQEEARLRLPENQTISSLTPADLLGYYWGSIKT